VKNPIIIVEDESQTEYVEQLFQLINKKGSFREIKEILDSIYEKITKRIRLRVKINGFEKNLFEFLHEFEKVTDQELKRIGDENSLHEEPDYAVEIPDVQDVLVSIVRSLVRTNTKELEKPAYYTIVINNFKKMKNTLVVENKVANKYWAFEKNAFRKILNKYTKEKIRKGKKTQFKKLMYLNLVISVLIALANETYEILGDHINKGDKDWKTFKKKHRIGRDSQAYGDLFRLGS